MHFTPCTETTGAIWPIKQMLRNIWKLHRTPKTIVSDQGSVFISPVTTELDKQLGIQLPPSTPYHPRTDRQSDITNKAIEKYVRRFTQYYQDYWVTLLPAAKFAYKNNNHTSIGVSPFKVVEQQENFENTAEQQTGSQMAGTLPYLSTDINFHIQTDSGTLYGSYLPSFSCLCTT